MQTIWSDLQWHPAGPVSLGNKIPLSVAFTSSIALALGLVVPIPTFCANEKGNNAQAGKKK
jgi:hypothetical protein